MEIETERQFKKISKKMRNKEIEQAENYDLNPDNVKELIKDILNEVHQTGKNDLK
jgi:hypothetical protein